MPIFPLKNNVVSTGVKYRRMLNKLNLEARERVADLDMWYPFDTPERQEAIRAIDAWKQRQKAIIFDRCYNPQPSIFERIINFIKK